MGKREFIARNVAAMFHDGDVVNLGVGIPTLASTYVPEGMTVLFHAENGCVGAGEAGGFPWDFSTRESVIAWMDSCAGEKGSWKTVHKDLCNASGEVITLILVPAALTARWRLPLHAAATWMRPCLAHCRSMRTATLPTGRSGKKLNGMGGAMDIVSGAKRSSSPWSTARKTGMRRSWSTARCRSRRRLREYDRDRAVHHRLQAGCLTVTAIAPV